MKSYEFITHGTSSQKDAKKIEQTGFEVKEGRATVSGSLIYSFKWATQPERRKHSISKTEVNKGKIGRMIIMKVPEDKSVDYSIHTDIKVDNTEKEISGYLHKYESGRRQFAIYNQKYNTVKK